MEPEGGAMTQKCHVCKGTGVRPETAERNAAIVARYASGMGSASCRGSIRMKDLAKDYGISVTQVRRIIVTARRESGGWW